jgi:LPS-assembly protein
MRRMALCVGALLTAAPLPVAAAGAPSGAGQTPMLFSADEVQYDEDLGLVVAKGNVEISQADQILLADTVTYNQRTDTVTASGHVSLLQPSGDVVFADFAELRDNLHDGFLRDLRILMVDRSRLAANTARRVSATRMELRRGVYSPCEPCASDPTRAPLWQIKADQIVDDKELQIVEYRDAVMELYGIPFFYTPYLSQPDPSVKRHSGFLSPSFGESPSNGFHFDLPYYWVIDQDKDATFTPMFTTAGGTYLGGEYRERFGNGQLTADGSLTFGSERFTAIDTTPVPGVRGDLFATGELDLNDDWRTGLDIQRSSDPTYLLRYHIDSPPDFLMSHVYAENFGPNSYGNISAWGFQSLEAGIGDSTQPIVAPVADYTWRSDPDVLGGRVSLEGNALNLLRLNGIDTRRLSVGSDWRLPFQGPIADQYSLEVSLREDGYQSDNIPIAGSATNATESALADRVFPQVTLTWHEPMVRHADGYSQQIEPVIMFAGSPYGSNPGTIPNEDSQGLEFDETSLFRRDRFPGFDRVDSGQRVDYGLRGGVYADGGGSTRFIIGQSYQFEVNNNFPVGSGLDTHLSDVVGRVTVSPAPYLDFTYRFRLDHDDLALRRQEIIAAAGPSNLRVGLNYLQVTALPDLPELPKTKQLTGSITAQLTRYWSLQLQETRSFVPSIPVTASGTPVTSIGTTDALYSGAAITYRDECLALVGSVTRSGILDGDVRPGTSYLLTVVFKNLGDFSF